MWLSTQSHVKGLNDWQRLPWPNFTLKVLWLMASGFLLEPFLKVQKRWTEKDDDKGVSKGSCVARWEKRAEKGETWHRNSSQQRASPTTFQACPLSLTGLSKLKRLVFFWREGVRNPFPFSLLIFLQWLPTNPRNNWQLSPTSGSLVWISLFSSALTFLNLSYSSALIFFILPSCQPVKPRNQRVVSGSKPYAWHRVHRMQYK